MNYFPECKRIGNFWLERVLKRHFQWLIATRDAGRFDAMKHISILVPDGDCSVSNIEGTYQIFSELNQLLVKSGRQPAFDIGLVGLKNEACIRKGLFRVYPELLISDQIQTDLIIIPALFGDMSTALKINDAFLPWITRQYKQGAEIACLCHGSFLLAATGLLDGRKCVTHWGSVNLFRRMFPHVQLLPDEIFTDDHGMYCSAGAYSSLNLILHLVEKYEGRELAILCAKVFEIEIDRFSQSPFMIFHAYKDHHDQVVKQTQEYIEKHYAGKISVEELAQLSGLSRRNLERRFRKITYHSIIEYLQKVRIEAAKVMLEKKRVNIDEAMSRSGYSDLKSFRSTFKKFTGLSPLAYSNKYGNATGR
jgi:transcriptional regulator GlxA family with amidase domain